jgi:hypothetical protein
MAKDIHLSIQERLLMFYNIHFSILYIYIYIYHNKKWTNAGVGGE